MRALVSLVAAAALAGCAGVQYAVDEYGGTPVELFVASDGRNWRVFDQPDRNRMMVTKSIGRALSQGAVQGLTLGAADSAVEGPIILYERAARDYLERRGRTCRIVRSFVIAEPQVEVQYDCAASAG